MVALSYLGAFTDYNALLPARLPTLFATNGAAPERAWQDYGYL
jgi:hypothetical protein